MVHIVRRRQMYIVAVKAVRGVACWIIEQALNHSVIMEVDSTAPSAVWWATLRCSTLFNKSCLELSVLGLGEIQVHFYKGAFKKDATSRVDRWLWTRQRGWILRVDPGTSSSELHKWEQVSLGIDHFCTPLTEGLQVEPADKVKIQNGLFIFSAILQGTSHPLNLYLLIWNADLSVLKTTLILSHIYTNTVKGYVILKRLFWL